MTVKVTVEYNKLGRIAARMSKNLDEKLGETARDVIERAQQKMYNSPRGGEGGHSAPGEPPAVQSGDLVNSAFVQRLGAGKWVAGFAAEHATHMEYGTIFVEPRPFFRITVWEVEEELPKLLASVWRASIT